jgi:hypothetical protein
MVGQCHLSIQEPIHNENYGSFSGQTFTLHIVWNFFAAQHGKGVVDGIGASVKRIAHNKALSRQVRIISASDYVSTCQGSKVKSILISDDEIKNRQSALSVDEVVKTSKNIKNISNCHKFEFKNGKYYLTSFLN